MYQHGFLSGLVECVSVLKMLQAAASLLYLLKAGNIDDVTDVRVLYVIGKDMKVVIGGLAANLFLNLRDRDSILYCILPVLGTEEQEVVNKCVKM